MNSPGMPLPFVVLWARRQGWPERVVQQRLAMLMAQDAAWIARIDGLDWLVPGPRPRSLRDRLLALRQLGLWGHA